MRIISRKTLLASAIATGFAMPAAAQSLCGGAGDAGQWIGGTEAASDVSTASAYMEQMALVLLRNEYVALFTVSQPTDVRLEAQGRGGGDPLIDLRDASGSIIVSDDDSGGEGASRIETSLQPGTYCLSMASYDGSPMTGFVRIGRVEQEALTAGTGMTQTTDPIVDPVTDPVTDPTFVPSGAGCSAVANYLGDGPIDGQIMGAGVSATAPVNQVDAWGFSLGASTPLSIIAENPSADPVITLYDSFGNYLAENDDFDGLNSRIDMITGLAAGDYCIEMRALSDETLPITVTVTGYDAAAALAAQYDTGEAAPPLDGSHPVTMLGALGNRVRQDVNTTSKATWYAFDIDAPGLLLVETVSNNNGDTVLYMYDDFGRQVAYNDDANNSLDSMLTARVMPGTYLVAVKQLSEGVQAPVRLLFERWMPAQ